MYPEKTELDLFLRDQGMHKNIKKNIKIINGEVKFVKLKKPKVVVDGVIVEDADKKQKKANFFSKRTEENVKKAE